MRFVFFVVAAVVAIVVGVVVLRLNETPPPPPPVVQSEPVQEVGIKTVDVLVAKVDVPVGTVIDSTMVDTQPWPQHLVLDSFISSSATDGSGGNLNSVVGRVARSQIQAREPFLKSKLADPNDPGFLSANLPAGMRAITIAIDSISGIAGYVFPGDKVDILFAHPSAGASQSSGGKISVAEVVASNVRVLAVGGREVLAADGKQAAAPASANNVTIEVSDEIAQHIRLAEKNGNLSLSLRSIKDDKASSPSPTTMSDISKVGGGAALIVVRGPGNNASGKITSSEGLVGADSSDSGANR